MTGPAPIVVDAGETRAADDVSLFFVGTATVLLRLGPFTVLTDPNFLHAGDHAHRSPSAGLAVALGDGLGARPRGHPRRRCAATVHVALSSA